MKETTSFKTCGNKGFHITFPNGVTVSTQFGGGNYSSNYNAEIKAISSDMSANTVEFAAWDKDGKWVTKQILRRLRLKTHDDVEGYVDIKLWLRLCDTARKLKPKNLAPAS